MAHTLPRIKVAGAGGNFYLDSSARRYSGRNSSHVFGTGMYEREIAVWETERTLLG
jgi:hypothetical protein